LKGYPIAVIDYPRFYYAARRGGGSDIKWIRGQLSRLDRENRAIACEIYEDKYLSLFNQGRYLEAREAANRWLIEFASEYGISKEEIEKTKVSEKTRKRIFEMIERIKAMKPRAKTILGLHRENMKGKGRI
jgi:hypothetical protein